MSQPPDPTSAGTSLLSQQKGSLAMRFILRTSMELESALSQLGESRASERDWFDRIARISHGIAGTAATLGFSALSEHALSVTTYLRESRGSRPEAQRLMRFDEVQRRLQHLSAEVTRARLELIDAQR